MNSYGLAQGDPANYSDPFGLCPPRDQNKSDCGYIEPTLFDPTVLIGGLWAGLRAVGAAIVGAVVAESAVDVAAVGVADAVVEEAAEAGTVYATKSAARSAVAEMGLPDAQAAAVNRAIGRATTNTTIGIVKGEGGNVSVSLSRAGRDGMQVVESVVSPDGAKTVVQRAYDASGKLVHVDPKT